MYRLIFLLLLLNSCNAKKSQDEIEFERLKKMQEKLDSLQNQLDSLDRVLDTTGAIFDTTIN